ncbi:hypothetical protein B0H67DRAFT_97183 [Lasiosphaeris hirsuta]|uniref:Uncharacterized protein n=1 Tax=Lasiosphaeris hirsuta TaxID=260670 RepID=A0AA40DII4_9PEZI|nr:hypothetical protein B0H67DRAFT_97183 [Lasiosphaeris hirsuta]
MYIHSTASSTPCCPAGRSLQTLMLVCSGQDTPERPLPLGRPLTNYGFPPSRECVAASQDGEAVRVSRVNGDGGVATCTVTPTGSYVVGRPSDKPHGH